MEILKKEWAHLGACRTRTGQVDPKLHGESAEEQHKAKRVCAGCPVKIECLAAALDNGGEHGVWGGMTEGERRKLLKNKPGVPSWRLAFEKHLRRQQEQQASPEIPRQRVPSDVPGAAGAAALGGDARRQLPVVRQEGQAGPPSVGR